MSPHNILVSIINGTGAAIEIVYVFIFVVFAPKKEKAKILGLFSFVVAVFSGVVVVSLLALHGNTRKLFCGFAAAIFSIIMYGSPLSIMVSKLQFLYRIISSHPYHVIMAWPACPLSLHFPFSSFGKLLFLILSFFVNHYFKSVPHCFLQPHTKANIENQTLFKD